MNRARKSTGHIYAAGNPLPLSHTERINGQIRNSTPKHSNNEQFPNKQMRYNSATSIGKIVTRTSTPKNSKNSQSANKNREIGKCYTNKKNKSVQRKKSIEIQTEEVLVCMNEEKSSVVVDKKSYYPVSSGFCSKGNLIKSFSTGRWNSKTNLLNIADTNTNIFNYNMNTNIAKKTCILEPYPTNNQNHKNLTNIKYSQNNKFSKQNKPILTNLQISQQKPSFNLLQQSSSKTQEQNNGNDRETKMQKLSEKYQKSMSKYEKHRLVLNDLLKNEGIRRDI